jgi:hypothetical protein
MKAPVRATTRRVYEDQFKMLPKSKKPDFTCMPSGLPDYLLEKLWRIPCTTALFPSLPYRPASAKLTNGKVDPYVIFFGRRTHERFWGRDPKRRAVDLAEVVDIMPSASQLPPRFASLLYTGGESRMGGIDFTIVMQDSARFSYTLGNLVDFVNYPHGYTQGDILRVEKGIVQETHIDHPERVLGGPDYSWCLFEESQSCLERISHERPMI